MNVVTGLGWSFEKEKTPMSLLRFKTENTEAITVVYCISLDGKTNKITLGKNTNTNKKALLGDVEIVNDNGTKTKVIFNPDKQEITVNGKTSSNILEVIKS